MARKRPFPVGHNLQLALDPLALGKLEAVLNQAATSITAPFIVPYAVSLGASGWEVGLISALPLMALNLSQFPGARWGARSRRPRAYLVAAGGLGRAAWLALALLLLSGRSNLPALFAVATCAAVSSGLLTPAWTAFLGRHVPHDRRGSYFGTRNLLAGVAGLGGAFIAAVLVSRAGFAPGNGLALTVAALAASGALAAQVLAVGVRPSLGPVAIAAPAEDDFRAWRLANVRRYVVYAGLMVLGAGMAEPFFSVHFINGLHGSPQTATTAIAVAGATVMLAQGLWGRVIDRHGLRVVGGATLGVIALLPLLWLGLTEPLAALPLWLLGGLMWAGCGLATFSLMLAISNDANRASVVAWVSTLQAPVEFAAPLAGGLLAERFGIPTLFAVSSGVLALCWLYFLRSFRTIGATGERPALPLH